MDSVDNVLSRRIDTVFSKHVDSIDNVLSMWTLLIMFCGDIVDSANSVP